MEKTLNSGLLPGVQNLLPMENKCFIFLGDTEAVRYLYNYVILALAKDKMPADVHRREEQCPSQE